MNKLIVAFILLTFLFSIIEGITQSGGVTTTALTENLTRSDDEISVLSTGGFLKQGVLFIGDEEIIYKDKNTDTFLRCERGINNTEASDYEYGRSVRTGGTEIIDSVLGFQAASLQTTGGLTDIPLFAYELVTKTLPKMLTWDYIFFEWTPLYYIRYFLYILSAGFLFMIGYYIFTAFAGLAQGILNR